MSLHFVFKRSVTDKSAFQPTDYIPYASVFLPEVISAQLINDGRNLLITSQHQQAITITDGSFTNINEFFIALEQYIM